MLWEIEPKPEPQKPAPLVGDDEFVCINCWNVVKLNIRAEHIDLCALVDKPAQPVTKTQRVCPFCWDVCEMDMYQQHFELHMK